ncbi:hypothetical protein ACS0TY_015801 [Phlomoides rotata]
MRRYCPRFTYAVSGPGLMYSVISVYVVGKISEIGGREGWFQDSLNKSRLDRYYLVLAGLSALNLIIFIPLAFHDQKQYQPRETSTEEALAHLAGLSALNLLMFSQLVSLHRYKSWETMAGVVDGSVNDERPQSAVTLPQQ